MGKNRERESELWRWGLLHDVIDLKTDARQLPEGIEVSVSGNYPRPARPEESVRGGYKLLVTRAGAIDVSYDYAPVKATGEVLEAGFALAVPAAQSEFRWLGQGPYAGYPGKDRLNEYGLFHLNRDDLYFPGNRRGVELASLASPSGAGVLLAGSGMTVDLENVGATTILSHLALVPGERSNNEGKGENVDVSSRLKAGSVKNIAGKFTLLPLGGHWPKPLTNWFGSPGDRVGVTNPFLRSYDQ
jgi:beta-galactosidase